MWIVRVAAVALMTVTLAFAPVFAMPSVLTLDKAAGLVHWAGCTADLVMVDSKSIPSAYYDPSNHMIVMKGMNQLPEDEAEIVLLHETGHCLQDQTGMFEQDWEVIEYEWDADTQALNMGCTLHIDPYAMDRFFAMLYARIRYTGDPDHGSVVDRMAHAHATATQCQVELPQA